MLLNIKCVFWFSLQISPEKFLIQRRLQQDITINVHRHSCKAPIIHFRFSPFSSSVGPAANATYALQPRRLIVLTLTPPHLFGHSHVRCQVPPRPRWHERSQQRKGELCGQELAGNFAWNRDFHINSGSLYMPQICDTGPTALLPLWRKACWGVFCPEKSWRLRLGLNPRTWVLKGSTLPLDHRSHLYQILVQVEFSQQT
jgi:hypothetical protein